MSDVTVLTDRFDRALLYATHVHGGQRRKGTSIPYVAHFLAVAATVLEYGGDEDLTIAALLHDSVECKLACCSRTRAPELPPMPSNSPSGLNQAQDQT